MDIYVQSYRAWRLRRLIGISVAVPTVLTLFLAAFGGGWILLLLPLTLGLPAAHALRYPGEWVETLIVSGVMTAAIFLVAVLGLFVGVVGDVVLTLLAIPAAIVAVLWLSQRVPDLLEEGTTEAVLRETTARTRLDAETLRQTMLVRPGHRDARVYCGEADENGVFVVTHRRATIVIRGEQVVTEPMQFLARLEEDSADVHEVRGVTTKGRDMSALRTTLRPSRRGTIVTVEELSEPMTQANAWGLWLTDSLADYLRDELDRAEGLRMRAFRCLPADGIADELQRRYGIYDGDTGSAAQG